MMGNDNTCLLVNYPQGKRWEKSSTSSNPPTNQMLNCSRQSASGTIYAIREGAEKKSRVCWKSTAGASVLTAPCLTFRRIRQGADGEITDAGQKHNACRQGNSRSELFSTRWSKEILETGMCIRLAMKTEGKVEEEGIWFWCRRERGIRLNLLR